MKLKLEPIWFYFWTFSPLVMSIIALMFFSAAYADEVMFYSAPIGTGSRITTRHNTSGACAIWWLGTKYRGGCATWAQWPTDWFDIANNFVNGTDDQRTADYKSFGCTPGPEDCSQKLPPDLIALFAQMLNDTKPVMPIYVVQPISKTVIGDRPIYLANAAGTTIGKATGIRVIGNTLCDGTKRLGTTNYYAVPGGYSICIQVP